MAIVGVKCSDGVVIEVDSVVVSKMSPSLRKKLDENDGSEIALDNVNSRSFAKVLEYCIAHCTPGITDLKTWDNKFVKVEPSILCELASAAYHLEIKPMVDLTCYAIAQLLKGNTPEEIRRIFNIIYDFGPEDDVPPPTIRDKLRNKWIRKTNKRITNSTVVEGTGSPSTDSTGASSPLLLPPPLRKIPRQTIDPTCNAPDTRTLDELLLFINKDQQDVSATGILKNAKKSKKKKKIRDIQKADNGHTEPCQQSLNTHTPHDSQQTAESQVKDNGVCEPGPEATSRGGEQHNTDMENITQSVGSSTTIPENGQDDMGWEGEQDLGDGLNEQTLDDLDREVEEFRLRLEAAKYLASNNPRQKVSFTTQIWNTT